MNLVSQSLGPTKRISVLSSFSCKKVLAIQYLISAVHWMISLHSMSLLSLEGLSFYTDSEACGRTSNKGII